MNGDQSSRAAWLQPRKKASSAATNHRITRVSGKDGEWKLIIQPVKTKKIRCSQKMVQK
jgi:hypothetical protein